MGFDCDYYYFLSVVLGDPQQVDSAVHGDGSAVVYGEAGMQRGQALQRRKKRKKRKRRRRREQ